VRISWVVRLEQLLWLASVVGTDIIGGRLVPCKTSYALLQNFLNRSSASRVCRRQVSVANRFARTETVIPENPEVSMCAQGHRQSNGIRFQSADEFWMTTDYA